jgi:hypothetical protein
MVKISIPRKIEQQFRSSFFKEEGFICLFIDLNAIDIKQRSYTSPSGIHASVPRKFKGAAFEPQGEKIPQYSFGFCPFNLMPSKDVPLKPLIGTIPITFLASPVYQ